MELKPESFSNSSWWPEREGDSKEAVEAKADKAARGGWQEWESAVGNVKGKVNKQRRAAPVECAAGGVVGGPR